MAARTKLGCGGSPTLRTAESRTTPITIDACGAWHPISTRSTIGGVLGHKSAPPTYGGAVMQLHEATLNQGVLVGSTQESHRNELIDGMSCISGRRTDRADLQSGAAEREAHACENAACPGRIPHDLRRTAVRSLVRAGIPQTVAMSLTGRTDSLFRRYDSVSALDLKDAARRLDASRAYSALTGDRAIALAGVSVTRPPVLCPAIYSRRLSLRQQ